MIWTSRLKIVTTPQLREPSCVNLTFKQATFTADHFPQFAGGTIKVPKRRPSSIIMESIELANQFADEAPIIMFMVDAVVKKERKRLLTSR